MYWFQVFFFQMKTLNTSTNIQQSDTGCAKGTSWNTRRIETGGDNFTASSHAIRKSIGINSGPRITTTTRPHLRPTSDWPVMLCDRLATDPRLGRDRLELPVWLGKSLHEIKISRVTCDRFTTVPNDMWGHRVIYDQPAKTCDQRRIQLRVGSLASEIHKFHDRFWRLKAAVELVDFNGEWARIIASIQE